MKETVYPKCFGEGVTVLNLITWRCKGFLVSHFPLTVLLWKYILLWALSFVFLYGVYNRRSSVPLLKQLKWDIGFGQNTQLAPRRQAERCSDCFIRTHSAQPQLPSLQSPTCLFFSWPWHLQQAQGRGPVPCPVPGSSLQQCPPNAIWDHRAMSFVPHRSVLCYFAWFLLLTYCLCRAMPMHRKLQYLTRQMNMGSGEGCKKKWKGHEVTLNIYLKWSLWSELVWCPWQFSWRLIPQLHDLETLSNP